MDKYHETFEAWNNIASLYQERFMNLDIYNDTYDFFCNSICGDNQNILEIGCGPGNITKYLLSKKHDFRIDGIDVSSNMIELARKNNPTANFKVMDSRHINELDTSYEGIICGFCLPYLSEIDIFKLISDSYYLLTDSGILYLSFVEGDQNKSGFQIVGSDNRIYFYYHNLNSINKLLIDNGFESPKLFRVSYKKADETIDLHTIVITKKKRTHNISYIKI